MRTSLTLAGAFAAGALLMVSAAMCLPDDPAPVPPIVNEDPRPPLPEGVLVCGFGAKPATDWNERDGYWAYCEPALVTPDMELGS